MNSLNIKIVIEYRMFSGRGVARECEKRLSVQAFNFACGRKFIESLCSVNIYALRMIVAGPYQLCKLGRKSIS